MLGVGRDPVQHPQQYIPSPPLPVSTLQHAVEAETEALALHLTSYGRSNNEADPGVWENSGVSAEFTNFNFVTDGWVLDHDDRDDSE